MKKVVLSEIDYYYGEIKTPKHFEIKRAEIKGNILVQFIIDENGKVIAPQILDTFNLSLNPTIIDRVMAIEFEPALQNGRPIKVRYNLPIVFK